MMCIVFYSTDAFKPVQNLMEEFNKISLLRSSQNNYHSSQFRFNPKHKLNISGVWLFVSYLQGIIL